VSRRIRGRQAVSKSLGIEDTPIMTVEEAEKPTWTSKFSMDRKLRVWKVAPGWQGWQWPLWEREITYRNGKRQGVIAIGWNTIDFGKSPYGHWRDDGPCPRELADWVKERLSREDIRGRTNPRYVARQGARFCKLMRKHDLIVAYSKKTVYGIAEVAGSPFHTKVTDSNALYANRRRVDWLTLPNKRVSDRLVYLFSMPRDTIHEITDGEAITWVSSMIKS
jgi:hypothetical protein